MILAGRFAILALLPAVAVASVAHLLARVEQQGAALRSAVESEEAEEEVGKKRE